MVLNNFSISKKIIEILLIILPITLLFSNILSELVLILLIIFYLSFPKTDRFLEIFKDPFILFLLIFWLYLIINYLINYDKSPSLERTVFFIRFPLFILAISFFVNKLNISLKKIFGFWVIIILITCFDLFVQYFTQSNLIGNKAISQGQIYRLGGFMDDELKISNLIFHTGVLSFSYFFSKKYFNNINNNLLSLLFLFLLVVSIFITAERANFITIVFFVFLFILFLSLQNKKLSLIILAFLLSSITIISLSNNQLSKRMITNTLFGELKHFRIVPDKSYLNKDSHYFAHYSAAYQIFQKNKLFGIGLKNFRNYCDDDSFDSEIHPSWQHKKCATHPHNFYFEILSEIGIIGFFILISFFIFSFYKIFRMFFIRKDNYLIISSLIILAYFIPFLPKGSFFTNWNAIIFWTVFAFIYANYNNLKKN